MPLLCVLKPVVSGCRKYVGQLWPLVGDLSYDL